MLSVTSAQLDAWVAALMFPLARVLGLIAAAPILSNRAVPVRVKVMLGVAVTAALAPVLPPMPQVTPGSGIGLAILVQESLIGLALGFVMRLVFSAIDLAGELIGLQMGLSFATFYDPQAGGQTAVVAEFLGLLAMLVFLALNGHLLLFSVLTKTFSLLPVGPLSLAGMNWGGIARWGTTLFSAGLLLALPIIAALLITNIALGVLTRAAPQLNLFAVGFPITLVVGFAMLMLAMPYLTPSFERLFEQGFEAMTALIQPGAPIR
jgi:flagellar biosynthetic protein FliR